MAGVMFAFIVAAMDALGSDASRVSPLSAHLAGKDLLLAEFKVGTTTRAIEFSSNGELIAAGNAKEDNKFVVMRWNVERKRLMASTKTDFETFVTRADVSPNGEMVLAADYYGNVAVFTMAGKKIAAFKMFERGGAYGGVRNSILDVKFVNNKEVLTVAMENIVSVRDVTTNVSKLYYLRTSQPDCATFSRESSTLAWADKHSIYIWTKMFGPDSRPSEIRIRDEVKNYRALACSDDGSAVICAYGNSEVRLIDVNSRKVAKAWNAHQGQTLNDAVALGKNEGFVTATEDEIGIWRQNGDLVAIIPIDFRGEMDEEVSCVASNRDSSLLAVGTRQKIMVFDLKRILKAKAK
jgi:WD40 repeat protein